MISFIIVLEQQLPILSIRLLLCKKVMSKQTKRMPVRYKTVSGDSSSDFKWERSLDLIFSPGCFTVEIDHTDENIGLPLGFCSSEHYIVGTLVVTDSGTNGAIQENRVMGQILMFTARENRETKLYARTFAANKWSEWRSIAFTGMYDKISTTDDLITSVEGLVSATKTMQSRLITVEETLQKTAHCYKLSAVHTLESAIAELDKFVPQDARKPGLRVVFVEADNVVRTYTFLSSEGFKNPTRWKSDVVNPYIDSEQPVGEAYRLSDVIDYINVVATGAIDVDAVYRFGLCGLYSSGENRLQILKDNVSLGTITLDSESLTGVLSAENMTIEVKLNSLELSYYGGVHDYSKHYNQIAPQLFVNALRAWESSALPKLEDISVGVAGDVESLKETVFEKTYEKVDTATQSGYYDTFKGAFTNEAGRICTVPIEVDTGDVFRISTNIGASAVIAYVAQWNGDKWVGVADGFKSGSGNADKRPYVVPFGVTRIAVCSYNATEPSLYKVSFGDASFYKKEEVYSRNDVYKKTETYSTGEVDAKFTGSSSLTRIYGVRNDLYNPALTTWERTGDAIGMVASVEKHSVASGKDDFIDVYPFNAIRECNIETLENGATKITYKGEPGFSLTDKDVFVEFPLWYERRYIKEGYEYREICAQQLGGFYPSPMFIEDGRVLDRVYIAKYETSVNGGVACSRSGKEPATYKTLAEFRELYQAKGEGYAGMDIRTVMSLQHLYLVRFAEKNTQNYIGGGYTDLYQPWGFASKDYSGTEGGEVIKKNWVRTYPSNSTAQSLVERYWIGKQIGFVHSGEQFMYDRATITNILLSEDGKQLTIYFDKEVEIITEAAGAAVDNSNTPVRTWFGGCGQNTGATDVLSHDTGSTALAVSDNKGSCAVKLFGLENMWGNVWHELDGIIFKGEYPFVGFSQKDYNNDAEGYIPIAHKMLEQKELGSIGAQFCFIGNMWIDNAYPWVAYPQAVRGGSPTDITRYTDGVNENSSYGDAYYFNSSSNNGESYEVHGGGFDHYERAGLFCHRCWNGIDFKWYLQGSRMQFKMV